MNPVCVLKSEYLIHKLNHLTRNILQNPICSDNAVRVSTKLRLYLSKMFLTLESLYQKAHLASRGPVVHSIQIVTSKLSHNIMDLIKFSKEHVEMYERVRKNELVRSMMYNGISTTPLSYAVQKYLQFSVDEEECPIFRFENDIRRLVKEMVSILTGEL